MVKKLLITLSIIALVTIAFSGTTYAAQEGETIVISEEVAKLNDLLKEGAITEEEYSKAISILLSMGAETATQACWYHIVEAKPNMQKQAARDFKECVERYSLTDPSSKKAKKSKKIKDTKTAAESKQLTAAERKQLKDAEKALIKAEKEEARAKRKAERERTVEERKLIIAEKERACVEDPKGKGCRTAKLQLNKIYEKLKILSLESREKSKAERILKKQAIEEKKARIKAEKELAKQASLEEQERIKAEKAAIKAEKKRLKAEWKKACAEDPESKACIEDKPIQKLKKTWSKIKKSLGG